MSDISKKLQNLTPEQRELLLKKLRAKKAQQQTTPETGIPKRPESAGYPLSHAQERLWFFDQLAPGSALYNISAAVLFSGRLDTLALEKSIQAVVERHQVLRVAFKTENGAPVQELNKNLTIPLQVTSADGRPLEEIAAEEAQTPFDLTRAPLLRARLITLDDERNALLLTIHHIVADGWSMGVFINETARFYRRFTGDESVTVDPLPIQYFDYAHWQKERMDRPELKQQLDYWSDALKGMPVLLELPLDHPRGALQTFKGRHHHFTIDSKTTQALRDLSRQEGTTLFITLLAAFQTLLYRYANQDDFGVGIPIANRNKKELEALIGFFVNTLVIRAQPRADQTFGAFLQQVRQTAFRAYDNQDIPFEKVVERVQPNRDNQVAPLFQMMFELQGDALGGLNFGNLTLENIPFETGTAKFDLLLIMEESRETLGGIMEYNADLFESSTIERMMGHFTHILKQVARHPDTPLSAIRLLDEKEQRHILKDWNDTAVPYPAKPFIHQYTKQHALKRPGHPALVYDEGIMDYARFEALTNKLAHALIKMGISCDDRIGVCMERAPEMVIALHGILKAGGAYVPFDPHHPEDRRAFMMEDSGIRLMLTQPALHHLFDNKPIECLVLDRTFETLRDYPEDEPGIKIDGDQLAYMIYTSGSTGKPKGTLLAHKSILNRLQWMQEAYKLTPDDVVLQKTPYSFDVSVWEFFWPFMQGATLVVARPEGHKDTGYLTDVIRRQGVTTMHFVPPMLKVFLEDPDSRSCVSLKRVICSGEALPYALSEKFYEQLPRATLYNLYGPTEAAVDVTAYTCPVKRADMRLPIGVPIANTGIYILDKALNPVPPGVGGELHIAGVQLARGYANRPDLTAEKFIPDPYSEQPGSRMYKTGDLCRYLDNGEIEYLGRLDHQVKIRGFRIELGEIETTLRQHPDIQDALVLARGQGEEKTLIAWYITPDGDDPGSENLSVHLRQHMPDYMVPSFFVKIDTFPLTANGKIDRRALPDPKRAVQENNVRFVSPRNRLEAYLAEQWKDVLGVDKLSMYDNFFDLGGNSLKAAVLINRLQEIVKKRLHVGMVFQAPRIAEFAMFAQEYFSEDVLEKFGPTSIKNQDYFKISNISAAYNLSDNEFEKFRSIIHPISTQTVKAQRQAKNPPAVFILSPPRSGSTLLRIMLAGHNKLFSPPELDLLSFNTMKERYEFFKANKLDLWLEATTHALKETLHLTTEEAEKRMREIVEQDMAVKDFYYLLQSELRDRLLVDKTPSYALDENILNKMLRDFDNPYFIHLSRHPYAMIYSFIEAKLDKNFFKYKHSYNRQQLAELIWTTSHQNITHFLEKVPADRQIHLRFEDILQHPEAAMRQICDVLNIEFDPEMLRPYQGQKMTEGLKDHSQMVGDFKFYLHQDINRNVADKWRSFHKEDFLADVTENLAESLGYVPQTEQLDRGLVNNVIQEITPVERQTYMPLSFAQQRLWFIDQLEPGSTQYNVPGAVRIHGPIDAERFRESMRLLVERHEILRTSFHTVEGQGMQKIHATMPVPFKVIDLRHLPADQAEKEAAQMVSKMTATVFRLDTLPLFKTFLYRLTDDEAILLLIAHHIITDGWSNSIFIQEISDHYQALARSGAYHAPRLSVQYVDVADWQHRWIESQHARQQLAYWQKELADAPPLLEIPTDFPRHPHRDRKGRRLYFSLSPDLSRAIRQCCTKNGQTAFMMLVAAFKTLMHHYARQNDVLIGTPVAGRTRKEMEELIGFFVNTLVLRTVFQSHDRFKDILERVRHTVSNALKNQDYPFDTLLEALKIERHLEHSPLFQVMFAMQSDDTRAFSGDLRVTPYQTDTGAAKFDLMLEMYDSDTLHGVFEYDTSLFRESTIERMKNHFLLLLEVVSKQPDARIGSLYFLTAGEEQRILHDWNATHTPWPVDKMIPELIREQARRTPMAPALKDAHKTYTYAEFDSNVSRWAACLKNKGLKTEQRVGIYMQRSADLVLALHAVMRAGGVYVPLDPGHPPERTRFMIEDADAVMIITDSVNHNKGAFTDIPVLTTATLHEEAASLKEDTPLPSYDPQQLAYMIYTSGSTGKPKGTLLQHAGFLNRLQWMQDAYPLDENDRVLQKTPFSFDVSVWEFFWPFMTGATLVVAKPEGHKDPAYLADLIREEQITTLHFVPPMLKAFLEEPTVPGCVSLKNVICSGEALPYTLSRRFYKLLPDCRLHNLYGPTEASIDVSHYTCPVSREDEKLPIGKPIANTRLYILNDALQPVPVGVSGELHISGIQLARGYANRPDLTAEKFIPDPFTNTPGARMYKTGDLCRYLENGEIEYIGRIDHQVKVRGFRIELGEIEAALRSLDPVEDCSVQVRAYGGQDKALVAYIVAADTGTTPGALRDALKDSLPDYMIPAAWIFLDAIPLTANGKVDRRALPDPWELGRSTLETEYVAPRNEKEELLAGLWQSLLKLEKVGVKDNFFELGGDSIVGIQLISAAGRAGLTFTPRELFEYPTIEGLAAIARQGVAIHAEQNTLTGPVGKLPIHYWFDALDLPQRHHWNQSVMLQSHAPLNPDMLKQVTRLLLERHDMLRWRYADDEQTILPLSEDTPFVYHDWREVPVTEQKSKLAQTVTALQSGLDPTRGRVFSVAYFSLSPETGDRLLIVAHHLVVDAVSWRVILEDLQLAYTQLAEGKSVALPEKTTSFPYWAERLQRYIQETDLQNERTYWLKSIPETAHTLQVKHPAHNVQKNVTVLERELDAMQTNRLQQDVPDAYNTRTQENLLAALYRAWYKISAQPDLLIDMESHGREALFAEVDLSRTVGWFTTLYPVVLKTSAPDNMEVVIKEIKEGLRGIPSNGFHYGLLRYLGPASDVKALADKPISGILFNYLGVFEQDEALRRRFEIRPEESGPEIGPENRRSHALEITASIVDGVLKFRFIYCPPAVDATLITRLADTLMDELNALIEHSLSEEAGGYTPSDFAEAGLDQDELDDVLSELDDLE